MITLRDIRRRNRGLTAAIALRQVGIDVQVYEHAPALREVGSGIGLMANALRALDHRGSAPKFARRASPARQAH